METNRRMERRMEAIALPPSLMQSIIKCPTYNTIKLLYSHYTDNSALAGIHRKELEDFDGAKLYCVEKLADGN